MGNFLGNGHSPNSRRNRGCLALFPLDFQLKVPLFDFKGGQVLLRHQLDQIPDGVRGEIQFAHGLFLPMFQEKGGVLPAEAQGVGEGIYRLFLPGHFGDVVQIALLVGHL